MSQQFLMDLENRLLTNLITPAELTAICLIPHFVRNRFSFQKASLFKTHLKNEILASPVMNFLNTYNWKGYSDRIRRTLIQWHLGKYPLVLWSHIPTPFELLTIQASGQRIITVFKKSVEWQQTHLGKSAWDFIVHDLIHADHFFENSDWREGQTEFYQKILDHWNDDLLLCARAHCKDQFDYLISDMNSHPQHLRQTLSALCLMAWKKNLSIDSNARLSSLEESRFQKNLNNLIF